MIAKFKTEDGWSMFQCVRIDTVDGYANERELEGERYTMLGRDGEKNKSLVLYGYERSPMKIVYGREAYLMNDDGDTIMAL
jgi:hypothetical protein